ncbi:2TM domain-containing protein [Gangjinia marincola]|uniref:2TM domain-containing protein n=1 Tax=Gangjinia marincola TaxID=578463 RepID=A0ABN1MGR0_9FLAO
MENIDKNTIKYATAKKRVRELKKFYGKLATYLIFIAIFAGINYYTNEWRNAWFLWIALFWGIGIAIHAGKVFGFDMFFGKNWEERKINEVMNKEETEEANRSRWE